MNKQAIYEFLKEKNIWFEIMEHEAVYNMEDLSKIKMPYPDSDGKNLFVCDDKKRNYYLIMVKGNKKVNLKEFKKKNNTRSLSFASEKDLKDIMNLIPGAVSPLGILNDKEIKVQFYIDQEFMQESCIVGVHPNDNTATVWLKIQDLISIIKDHGNNVYVIKI